MSEQSIFEKIFGVKLSQNQAYALALSLMIIVSAVSGVSGDLLRDVLGFGEKALTREQVQEIIEEHIDLGLGGSPYMTEKPCTLIIDSVTVGVTTYTYGVNGTDGTLWGYDLDEQSVFEWAFGNFTIGEIYVKSGTYDVVGLTASGITLTGEGRSSTILRADGAGDIITMSGTNGLIRNMFIDGNDQANDGVVLSGSRTRALNLYIEDCTEAGIEISAAGGAFVEDCRIKQIGASIRAAGTRGVDIVTTGSDIEVINCIISEVEICVYANGGTNRIMDNHLWGGWVGVAVSPSNSHGEHIISRNFIEDNYAQAVTITGHTAWSVLISDNIIDGNVRNGGNSSIWINPLDAPSQYDAIGILIANNVYDHVTSTSPLTLPDYHILIDDSSSVDNTNIRIEGENFRGYAYGPTWDQTNPAILFTNPGGNCTLGECIGFISANSGTGTLPNAGPPSSVVITHGLEMTPLAEDITITLTENPTNTPGAVWVDTITATTFTVNCENDPGASNLDFSWTANIRVFR